VRTWGGLWVMLALGAAACTSSVENRLDQALLAVRQGDYEGAVAAYRQVLKTVPDAAHVHANLGYALLQLGRYPEALSEFEAARFSDGDARARGALLHNWGNALEKLGRYREAAERYEAAIDADPTRADVFINWGNTQVQLGDLEGAARYYAQGLALDPESALGWFNRGYTLERLQRPIEALTCFRRYLELEGGKHPSDLAQHARKFVSQAEAAGQFGARVP